MDTKLARIEWEDWADLLEVPDCVDAAFGWAMAEVDRLTEEKARRREAYTKVGAWLSAALGDPSVCDEFKRDIEELMGVMGW